VNPASAWELRPAPDSYSPDVMLAHLLDTHRIGFHGPASRDDLTEQHRLDHLAAMPGTGPNQAGRRSRAFTHHHEGGIPLEVDYTGLLLGRFVLHVPRAEGSHMAFCAGAEIGLALGDLEPTALGWQIDSKGVCARCVADVEGRGLRLVVRRKGAEIQVARNQVIGAGR
jgi:hypothetical protein